MGWEQASLDDLVSEDARVRQIWEAVEKLDLSAFDAKVRAIEGGVGRDAIDSRLLLALWVFATSEGLGSARRLEQLCARDIMYRWLCGGVSVNHHTLSDFRTKNGVEIDGLLTQLVGSLLHAGVITLTGVAQDGMKLRASAGTSSFKTQPTLEEYLLEATREIAALRKQLNINAAKGKAKQAAAKLRLAERRAEKVSAALENVRQIQAERDAVTRDRKAVEKRKPPRASTTDADARNLKQADGGYRPAVNVQFSTDVDSGVIVGVSVSNHATDFHELQPTISDLLIRTEGRLPEKYLMDGGYASAENIESLAEAGVTAFSPVRKPRLETTDRFAPQPGESDALTEWRARMGTAEGKETYKLRAPTAERVNADMRGKHGMTQLLLRGMPKIGASILLSALTFNILRSIALAA